MIIQRIGKEVISQTCLKGHNFNIGTCNALDTKEYNVNYLGSAELFHYIVLMLTLFPPSLPLALILAHVML